MVNITWLGHSCIKLQGSKTIYFDPFQLKAKDSADIICISHSHYDHCSVEDVKLLVGSNTEIIAPPDCKKALTAVCPRIITAEPNKTYSVQGMTIKALPAYNINKEFHPRVNNWVGYVVELDGEKFYHAGDSDCIPEMKGLKVDTAFLPIGGKYTMNAREAANAFKLMHAKNGVPMHYNSIIGTQEDADLFNKLIK